MGDLQKGEQFWGQESSCKDLRGKRQRVWGSGRLSGGGEVMMSRAGLKGRQARCLGKKIERSAPLRVVQVAQGQAPGPRAVERVETL